MLLEDQRSIKMIDFGTARDLGRTAKERMAGQDARLHRRLRAAGADRRQAGAAQRPVRPGRDAVPPGDRQGARGLLHRQGAGDAARRPELAAARPQYRWFFELIRINLSEDVNDRYFSAREIKADLERTARDQGSRRARSARRRTRCGRRICVKCAEPLTDADAALHHVRQEQPHGQPILHPLRQSAAVDRLPSVVVDQRTRRPCTNRPTPKAGGLLGAGCSGHARPTRTRAATADEPIDEPAPTLPADARRGRRRTTCRRPTPRRRGSRGVAAAGRSRGRRAVEPSPTSRHRRRRPTPPLPAEPRSPSRAAAAAEPCRSCCPAAARAASADRICDDCGWHVPAGSDAAPPPRPLPPPRPRASRHARQLPSIARQGSLRARRAAQRTQRRRAATAASTTAPDGPCRSSSSRPPPMAPEAVAVAEDAGRRR